MAVILECVRLPIGKKDGFLSSLRPDDLYSRVLSELVTRSKIDPEKIEDVITGCVTQSGEQGANIGRLSVLLSNLHVTVPSITLNRMCGSSQQAIHFAAQVVDSKDANYIIAGGVENMSRCPMFSDLGGGYEKLNPELLKKQELIHQGESAERIAEKYGLTRDSLDEFSCQSHERAYRATQEGAFRSQIIPVGDKVHDEGIRYPVNREKIAQLKGVFRKEGVITAANSSQISDGAAALLIANEEVAKSDGLLPKARFRSRVVVAGDPTMQLLEVIPATQKALERARLKLNDIDRIEINEAFASVVLAWASELRADLSKVNVNGGAIAMGHPLGATGAILMTKLVGELERRDKQFGLQVMCIGLGMATATVIERMH